MAKRVYHRNDARPALIEMGLSAKRIFFMCLAKLPRVSNKDHVIIDFDPGQEFIISVKDYSELCEIDYSAAYRQLVEGVRELRGYVLELDQALLKKKQSPPTSPIDWIEPFTVATDGTGYSKGEGYVKVKFAKQLAPLISDLRDSFTGQFFMSAVRLPEGNAGKLYLILREWISSGYFLYKTIEVDEFKDALGVSYLKNYKNYAAFKQSFFDRAVKKVIEKTEFIEVNMEIVERRARKAYKVKLSYKYSTKEIEKKDKIVEKVLSKQEVNKPLKRSAIDVLEEKISNFNFNDD